MKKIILILLITISVKNSNAQVTDTLAYLKNIVTNKAQYIGQPFSTLYNTLQIQIKLFQPFAAMHRDKTKETSTSFAFYNPGTANELYLTFPKLRISWQSPLNITQSDIVRKSNNNGGAWIADAYSLYKDAIIADIKVRE